MSLIMSGASLVPQVKTGAELCLKGGRSLFSGVVFFSELGVGAWIDSGPLEDEVVGSVVEDEVCVEEVRVEEAFVVALERSRVPT